MVFIWVTLNGIGEFIVPRLLFTIHSWDLRGRLTISLNAVNCLVHALSLPCACLLLWICYEGAAFAKASADGVRRENLTIWQFGNSTIGRVMRRGYFYGYLFYSLGRHYITIWLLNRNESPGGNPFYLASCFLIRLAGETIRTTAFLCTVDGPDASRYNLYAWQ